MAARSTWEYYFPFAGSPAPFISSISQGTAIQSLARAGDKLKDPNITAAATAGSKAFRRRRADRPEDQPRRRAALPRATPATAALIIFNMFAQALDGLHDYAEITGDASAQVALRAGLDAARVELPQSDTGAWSYYELGGASRT